MENSELRSRASRSLERLLPRLQNRFSDQVKSDPGGWSTFIKRLQGNFIPLFDLYYHLYARQYDFFFHLEELLTVLAQSWLDRSGALRRLDADRESNPEWFQSNTMVGGVCYVDRFGENLAGLKARIPYFKELGLTYLHLMPLFLAPDGDNDGGYAVSSYREVAPNLGTMEELRLLAEELHKAGINLVVDLVFNHTSNEHRWAQAALAGEPEFQEFYYIFPDRLMPDAYEQNLREIFPDEHGGAFTYQEDLEAWVWTTFHSYQWDLNYSNPAVFNFMVREMLFLANVGVDVLRLDAVAFIWKQLGTVCENLPEAHILIKAFNQVARIAAPGLLFKSEAIVHPDEVVRYIHPDECQLSYNPLLMALLWNTLATRETGLLRLSLQERFKIHPGCSWVNYVRCHDDIGWTFSDEDADRLGINGYDHRRFLNDFFMGRFPGSFARGLPFQENLKTGDARISGTCASLTGLEKAIKEETGSEIDLAIGRILLIHAIIMTIGGIPLIYLGDEIGVLNDYSFRQDPIVGGDTRWVHRPRIDWEQMERRKMPGTIEHRIFTNLQQIIQLRTSETVFAGNEMQVLGLENDKVLAFIRVNSEDRVMFLGNFSEQDQTIPANEMRLALHAYHYYDALTGENLEEEAVQLGPFQFRILFTIEC